MESRFRFTKSDLARKRDCRKRSLRRSVTGFHASESCPFIAGAHRFAHRLDKFFRRVIVSPTAAFTQLNHMRTATLGQCEPFARHAVVRTGLPGRHEMPEAPALPGSGVQCRTRACEYRRSLKAHNFTLERPSGGVTNRHGEQKPAANQPQCPKFTRNQRGRNRNAENGTAILCLIN